MSILNVESERGRWLLFIFSVLCVKLLIFLLDPLPMFFLGDSASYIQTAVNGWIPPDRSFTYGFIIRAVAVAVHSLTPLVTLQVFTSGINAIVVAYLLHKFFKINSNLSFICGLLCAIEPHQLMYERYVMTEAFSLFIFVCYLTMIFHYMSKPRLRLLAAVQITGTILISLRLSYLPLVLIYTILVPLLIIPGLLRKYSVELRPLRNFFGSAAAVNPVIKTVTIHLLFSVLLTSAFHLGYRELNGFLTNNPPSYQYRSGTIVLTAFLPIVKPDDFPRHDISREIFGNVKYDLNVRNNRVLHHWHQGGLIDLISQAIPDPLEADHVAGVTAFNAIKRDPVGAASVIVSTFADFWNLGFLKGSLLNDRGDRPLPKELLETLRNSFGLQAENLPFLKTFTNSYYMDAWFWYLLLLCSPLFAFLNLFICRTEVRSFVFVVLLSSLTVVIVSSTFVEGVTVRYLHPLGWLAFLVLGPLLDFLLLRHKKAPKQSTNTTPVS
ncbi:MAG: hypothetical protein P8013_10325 [Candidatus Sulfobium sp.]